VDVAGDAAAGNRGVDGDADGAGAPQVVFTSSSFDHAGATATPPRSDPFPEVMHGDHLASIGHHSLLREVILSSCAAIFGPIGIHHINENEARKHDSTAPSYSAAPARHPRRRPRARRGHLAGAAGREYPSLRRPLVCRWLENIFVDAPCFLKVLSDKCLNRSIVTRAHVPRQVARRPRPRGRSGPARGS
jgi:hypothetical protein